MPDNDIATLIREHRVLLEYAINDVIAQFQARGKPAAAGSTGNELSYEKVRRLIDAAREEAIQRQIAIVIAICDQQGEFILSYRMPGSSFGDIPCADKKAAEAVLSEPGHEKDVAYGPHAGNLSAAPETHREYRAADGAYPIYLAEKLAGGIGISGGSAEQNNHIAIKAVCSLNQGVNNEHH